VRAVPRMLLAAGVAAAATAPAAPAAAACAGTSGTVVVCVDPTGATYYEDCVYTGGSGCTTVRVPGPTVRCGGDVGVILAMLCASIGPP
jgi:hypothetical protein